MMKYKTFTPARGASNRHLQTLLPILLKSPRPVVYERQALSLPDGDFVDLDWLNKPARGSTKPVLVIFHGLEGSSQSHYARTLMQLAQRKNWHAVVMNFRGCSGRENKKSRLYHSGETGDAGFFIAWLKLQYPMLPVYAVGFSLGGNMLLKLAGEAGEGLSLNALVSVSAPIMLDESTRYMIRGISRFYQLYLLRSLKRKLLTKFRHHDYEALIGLTQHDVKHCKDIREFDNLFTAQMHGFKDADDYYRKSSAYSYIKKIKKPCLILHAADDPIAPSGILPDNSELPEHVQLEITERGGHVGFFGGTIVTPEYWLADRILAYLSEYPVND